ncbi:brix domain-containing protein 1 [Halteromyces radiatus]|uniref:brix domain-containing protein 1 n=1 Tax=Halteromyces radiatus TaxID=101107 RepID=UPI002220E65B|nr:brix domain-containing protein 1 [Halteromyces radiatus]KAI8085052.1 brix domain-containing protein 1 [Halteromyces radiatus]
MLRTVKPKTARTKRFFKNRESKVHENPKTALIVHGSTTSQVVTDALKDLYAMKRPNAIHFTKKNEIKPFEDEEKLEFFSNKNDASLMVVGTHLKKRPHNLTFIRMFNHQVLDMFELGVEKSTSMSQIKGTKCSVGMKPLLVFNGEAFDSNPTCQSIKNYFLDFFNGDASDAVNLNGLEYVVSFTALSETKIVMRTYTVQMKKSGVKTPRVELEEMGPHYDFVVRRANAAKADLWKAATKVPTELKKPKVKNVNVDEMGDKLGRIHVGQQELHKIQTRKMKGLKKRAADDSDEEESTNKKQKSDD